MLRFFAHGSDDSQRIAFAGPRGPIEVAYLWTRDGGIEPAGTGPPPGSDQVAVVSFGPQDATLEVAGVRRRFHVTRAGQVLWVHSALGSVRLSVLDRLPVPTAAAERGSLLAPMPGNVVRVSAAAGDKVAAGQVVLVLEAMKMEHKIAAPTAGVLAELRVGPGAQVNAGDVLAVVTPDGAEPSTTDSDRHEEIHER